MATLVVKYDKIFRLYCVLEIFRYTVSIFTLMATLTLILLRRCGGGNNLNTICKSLCANNYEIRRITQTKRCESTTIAKKVTDKKGLMEFFDDEKNWGAVEVKVGREWRLEELRIKSNTDLHKLWYILLKERNLLLTMEEESKEQVRLFPNPERLDKVEMSMENLESVIRERNRAYFQLETGQLGERIEEELMGPFGLPVQHKQEQHFIPKEMNKQWLDEHVHDVDNKDVKQFILKYREQERQKEKRKKSRDYHHVMGLLKRFPEMDLEALKQQYPDVDLEKAKNNYKSCGHFVPK